MSETESKTNLKKWIAALRSGEYKQTTGQLFKPWSDSYCSLGVLSDLYRRENGGEFSYDGLFFCPSRKDSSPDSATSDICALSPEVIEWIGKDVDIPQDVLVRMNDNLGSSFKEIADYLENIDLNDY